MLLRLFDRENLRLIPTVEFAARCRNWRPSAAPGATTPERHPMDRRGRSPFMCLVAGAPGAGRPATTCSIPACRRRCSACCTSWRLVTRGTRRLPAWPCGSSADGYPQFAGPERGLMTTPWPASAARPICGCRSRAPTLRPAQRRWLAPRAAAAGVAGLAGGATGPLLPPRLRRIDCRQARRPALFGRRRHVRRRTRRRAAAQLAAAGHLGRGAAAGRHRRPRACGTFRSASWSCVPERIVARRDLALAAELEMGRN